MSEIITFYKDKTIFLTGATGFIGKLLIEKLLRKCEPKKIYLLIRCKKNMDLKFRTKKLLNEVVFDPLRKEKPNFFEKLEVVTGDLSEDYLGMNEKLTKEICENVEIVLHGGATVKFAEPLKLATNINVKGTISIIKLCHQIKKLQAFIYISTAFSNCHHLEIEEEFYNPYITCNELINIVEKLKEDEVNATCNEILNKWPNTYAFTKAVAENAVQIYAKNLPVAVFRPSIVTSTFTEPLPGWIDNLYGPTGIVSGSALGILRVAKIGGKEIAEIVPSDKVVNCILAVTYKRSILGYSSEIPIYNFVTRKENSISWEMFVDSMVKNIKDMPPSNMIWPPMLYLQSNVYFYEIYSFFLQLLPALIIDIVTIIQQKTPSALTLHIKLCKYKDSISFFGTRTWNFSDNNVRDLWNDLSKEDKIQFNFNMSDIDWPSYLKIYYRGVRMYLLKETPDTLGLALKKYNQCNVIKNTVFILFCVLLVFYIISL